MQLIQPLERQINKFIIHKPYELISRERFFCFISGKKIKIKTKLPISVGGENPAGAAKGEKKRKEKKQKYKSMSDPLYLGLWGIINA